jgi:hypothetical protein
VYLQPTRFIHQAADRYLGDAVLFRNYRQTHSRTAVCNNLCPVDVQRCTAYSPTFQISLDAFLPEPFRRLDFFQARQSLRQSRLWPA